MPRSLAVCLTILLLWDEKLSMIATIARYVSFEVLISFKKLAIEGAFESSRNLLALLPFIA